MSIAEAAPEPLSGYRRSTRTPLADLARDRLRAAILGGELHPGEPLVEAELSERFGMSKTPIREALRLLAHSGLVVNDKFRTWRVRRMDEQSVAEIFQMRELLEPFAVRQAGGKITPERERALRQLLAQAKAQAEDGDFLSLNEVNRELHIEMCAGCENRELLSTLDRYRDQLSLVVIHGWRGWDSSRREHEDHVAIVEALIAGDGDRAARLMFDHVHDFGNRFIGRSTARDGR